MTKYLVEFRAAVGRKKENVSDDDPGASLHSPIELKFFGIVEAETREQVDEKVVCYGDPGFKTQVVTVHELGDTITAEDLIKLMPLAGIITEMA